ncbi:MAG TPA: hypothetical protein VH643_17855 [Gemmataceae bacterium]|jgi:hypothetical protein
MTLQTLAYMPDANSEHPDPSIGLPELRRGLGLVVLGNLMSIGVIAATVGLLWYVFSSAAALPGLRKTPENLSVLVFTAILVLGLLGLVSLATIVRGKWICLMNAPESYHAKWFMFAAIVCIVAGPALNVCSPLFAEKAPNTAKKGRVEQTTAALRREIEEYKKGMPTLDTRGWTKLAGDVAGLLSGVFFVLFLRAVALSWGYQGRARFAELYLIFLALLVAGLVVLLRNPSHWIDRPQFLLALAGGWLLSGVWYFVLILVTIAGLQTVRTR